MKPVFRCLEIAGVLFAAGNAYAAIITDPNDTPDFGWALGLGDENLAIGAPGKGQPGTAYFYTNGTVLMLQKQNPTTGPANSYFGYAVDVFGNNALVGDFTDGASSGHIQVGAAYYYRDLNAASGGAPVTETLKLEASDGEANAYFGRAVSLYGDDALVGAFGDRYNETHQYVGAAYYFRGLDSAVPGAGGVVTETLKLTSDRALGQNGDFGLSVSLSGGNALVGTPGLNANRGEVYYYRDLPNAVVAEGDTLKETFVLLASDGSAGSVFGRSVSLDGNAALVGADGALGDDGNALRYGAAYYYNNLDQVAPGAEVNQTLKLVASDSATGMSFGYDVSLSEDNALVGASLRDSAAGAAYFFKGLSNETPGGIVTETIIFTASDGQAEDLFGVSVAINGNKFAIGADHSRTPGFGKVYTGDIRAFTVLNDGNTDLATEGLSFVSRDDWVIGATTSGNSVTVSYDSVTDTADVADVTANGKHIYVGQQAGANDNALLVEGTLLANDVFVGAGGNSGNTIAFSQDAQVSADAIYLALGNSIALEDIVLGYTDLIDWLTQQGGIDLYADQTLITIDNAAVFLQISTEGGYTLYTAIPEPSTYAAAFAVIACGAAVIRRRRGLNA